MPGLIKNNLTLFDDIRRYYSPAVGQATGNEAFRYPLEKNGMIGDRAISYNLSVPGVRGSLFMTASISTEDVERPFDQLTVPSVSRDTKILLR